MEEKNKIPGFKPGDYDYIPSIEDMELTEAELDSLRRMQKETEDGEALGSNMEANYDSYLVIGSNKYKVGEDVRCEPESACGACHIDPKDPDVISEMGKILGHLIFNNFDLYRVIKQALSWDKYLRNQDLNPEPPVHEYLEANERFHMKRYERIYTEERQKIREEFIAACGNHKKRHDMAMRNMLIAIADQLNDNEPAEIDFFCNFDFGEKSDGDNVSAINIRLRPYPCTWDEADAKMEHFKELCKEYDVPCHIVWLED